MGAVGGGGGVGGDLPSNILFLVTQLENDRKLSVAFPSYLVTIPWEAPVRFQCPGERIAEQHKGAFYKGGVEKMAWGVQKGRVEKSGPEATNKINW